MKVTYEDVEACCDEPGRIDGLYDLEGNRLGFCGYLSGYFFVRTHDATGASDVSLELSLKQWVHLRRVLATIKDKP
jgi:hypothetical protein